MKTLACLVFLVALCVELAIASSRSHDRDKRRGKDEESSSRRTRVSSSGKPTRSTGTTSRPHSSRGRQNSFDIYDDEDGGGSSVPRKQSSSGRPSHSKKPSSSGSNLGRPRQSSSSSDPIPRRGSGTGSGSSSRLGLSTSGSDPGRSRKLSTGSNDSQRSNTSSTGSDSQRSGVPSTGTRSRSSSKSVPIIKKDKYRFGNPSSALGIKDPDGRKFTAHQVAFVPKVRKFDDLEGSIRKVAVASSTEEHPIAVVRLRNLYNQMQGQQHEFFWEDYKNDPFMCPSDIYVNKRTAEVSIENLSKELNNDFEYSTEASLSQLIDASPPVHKIPTCDKINARFIRIANYYVPDKPRGGNEQFRLVTNATASRVYDRGSLFIAKQAKTPESYLAQTSFHSRHHHPNIIRPICSFENTLISPFIEGIDPIAYASKLPYNTFGETKMIALLAQLISIFFHLHSARMLMNEIDINNFVVNRDNELMFVAGSKVSPYNGMATPEEAFNHYTAPEVFAYLKGPMTTAKEMWGYGCIAAQIIGAFFARGAMKRNDNWIRARLMRRLQVYWHKGMNERRYIHIDDTFPSAIPTKYIIFLRPFFNPEPRLRSFWTLRARQIILSRSIFGAIRWNAHRHLQDFAPSYVYARWEPVAMCYRMPEINSDGSDRIIPIILWDSVYNEYSRGLRSEFVEYYEAAIKSHRLQITGTGNRIEVLSKALMTKQFRALGIPKGVPRPQPFDAIDDDSFPTYTDEPPIFNDKLLTENIKNEERNLPFDPDTLETIYPNTTTTTSSSSSLVTSSSSSKVNSSMGTKNSPPVKTSGGTSSSKSTPKPSNTIRVSAPALYTEDEIKRGLGWTSFFGDNPFAKPDNGRNKELNSGKTIYKLVDGKTDIYTVWRKATLPPPTDNKDSRGSHNRTTSTGSGTGRKEDHKREMW